MNEELQKIWRIEQHKVASQVIQKANADLQIDIGTDADITNRTFPQHYMYHSLPVHTQHVHLLGGVDVSFGPNNTAIAVYVITQGQDIVYCQSLRYTLTVPYVSSYLSFREIEPLTKLVLQQMKDRADLTPEVILVDGNGILHERGAGIASFLGVRTGIPTIGVAKSLYCMDGIDKESVLAGLRERVATFPDMGLHANVQDCHEVVVCTSPIRCTDEVTDMKSGDNVTNLGESIHIMKPYYGMAIPIQGTSGQILTAALVGHGGRIISKKKQEVKQVGTKIPIYISIGHNISLQEAIQICAGVSWAKIPEPVRQADLIGRDLMRQSE